MTTLRGAPQVSGPDPETLDAEDLIKEARRLRRRHYLRIGTGVVVIAVAIGAAVAVSQSGGGGHSGHRVNSRSNAPKAAVPPAPPAPRPPGIALPTSALFTQIELTSNGLLLSGETPSTAGSPQPTCVAAAVNPTSLTVGPLQTGSCNDPLLYGQTVEAVNTYLPGSICCKATISINVANATTGAVIDGPVVMTYESYSDTKPVIVYGTQWLWIYDVNTTNGPELLQVSTQSGEVVDTVAMPKLYRPLLAADDAGLWVANSQNESPPEPALSYVAAGSSAPDVVLSGPLPICWLTAAGTSAWVGAGLEGACAEQTTERFEDYGQAAVYSTLGDVTPLTVIGDEASGLWTTQWAANGDSQEIVSIDPDTGLESVAATVASLREPLYTDDGLAQGQAVYFDGALYLLEPPFRFNQGLGYSSIVRVSP